VSTPNDGFIFFFLFLSLGDGGKSDESGESAAAGGGAKEDRVSISAEAPEYSISKFQWRGPSPIDRDRIAAGRTLRCKAPFFNFCNWQRPSSICRYGVLVSTHEITSTSFVVECRQRATTATWAGLILRCGLAGPNFPEGKKKEEPVEKSDLRELGHRF